MIRYAVICALLTVGCYNFPIHYSTMPSESGSDSELSTGVRFYVASETLDSYMSRSELAEGVRQGLTESGQSSSIVRPTDPKANLLVSVATRNLRATGLDMTTSILSGLSLTILPMSYPSVQLLHQFQAKVDGRIRIFQYRTEYFLLGSLYAMFSYRETMVDKGQSITAELTERFLRDLERSRGQGPTYRFVKTADQTFQFARIDGDEVILPDNRREKLSGPILSKEEMVDFVPLYDDFREDTTRPTKLPL